MTIRIENPCPRSYQVVFKPVTGETNPFPDMYSNSQDPMRAYVSEKPVYFQIWHWDGRKTPPVATGVIRPDKTGGEIIYKNQEPIKLSGDQVVSVPNAPEITFGAVRSGLENIDDIFRTYETGFSSSDSML